MGLNLVAALVGIYKSSPRSLDLYGEVQLNYTEPRKSSRDLYPAVGGRAYPHMSLRVGGIPVSQI